MGTANAFEQGLQVTLWGMGLVFLTLIIVALVIWLLDKLFRPRPDSDAGGADGPETGMPAQVGPALVKAADISDQVAAIAAAIAIERGKAKPVRRPGPRQPFLAVGGEENVVGEVVTVAQVDAGSGMWKNAARLKSSI
jgi:sodium pump decarboxylase gamma subunit